MLTLSGYGLQGPDVALLLRVRFKQIRRLERLKSGRFFTFHSLVGLTTVDMSAISILTFKHKDNVKAKHR